MSAMPGPILSSQEAMEGVNAALTNWSEGRMGREELAAICDDLWSRVVGGDSLHPMKSEEK